MSEDGQLSIFDFKEALPEEKQSVWKVTHDTGVLHLTCGRKECEGNVSAVMYARAVGLHGYRFCPYCGARMMNAVQFENTGRTLKWPKTLSDHFRELEEALP